MVDIMNIPMAVYKHVYVGDKLSFGIEFSRFSVVVQASNAMLPGS